MRLRPDTADRRSLRAVREYDTLGICTGDVVLDIGANIGTFSVAAATLGAAVVAAYEPEPENYALLVENTSGESVECHQGAVVGDRSAMPTVKLWVAKSTDSHSVVAHARRDQSIEVPAFRWSEVLGAMPFTVVKVDIEGGEYDFSWLELPRTVRALAVEFHMYRSAWREAAAGIVGALRRQGFDPRRAPQLSATWNTTGVWVREVILPEPRT